MYVCTRALHTPPPFHSSVTFWFSPCFLVLLSPSLHAMLLTGLNHDDCAVKLLLLLTELIYNRNV